MLNPTPTPDPNPTPTPTFADADVDGLDDNFENSLADGFTPVYHISAGENSGTGFATFNNSPSLSINQLFGPVPPISYYRVKPMGAGSVNGVPHGIIQLDYLTLWNRDDGVEVGALCYFLSVTLGLTTEAFPGHEFDRERSATLIAAPLVNGSYDTNFANYKAYGYFTAAHEDTFLFDHSLYFFPQTPIIFGGHINLGLSRAKHGTYPYNPDYQPIFQNWVIFSVYESIEISYQFGEISYLTYLELLYAADTVFFACAIEHFQEQGGTFAGTRINVGELPHPINNAGFIQDAELTQKLNKYIF